MKVLNLAPMTMAHNIPMQYRMNEGVIEVRTWNAYKGEYAHWSKAVSVAVLFNGDVAAAWSALESKAI